LRIFFQEWERGSVTRSDLVASGVLRLIEPRSAEAKAAWRFAPRRTPKAAANLLPFFA
jgi:hypothetical protein